MSQYFHRPYDSFDKDINVKVDLSNYATNTDLKNITHVNTLNFSLKLSFLDKLDIDELKPVPVDLSK